MAKQPLVTEQTRIKLLNSFWKLYKKKDISKITIGELCANANYERTTFYRYFLDIEDIKKHVEDEIINNIKNSIKENLEKKQETTIFFEGFKKFTSIYGEYIVVFNEKGNASFCTKFKELIKQDVYEYLNFNVQDEAKKELLFEFMFQSLINSYTYWYRHKKDMSLEQFVKFSNSILLNGTKSIIEYK